MKRNLLLAAIFIVAIVSLTIWALLRTFGPSDPARFLPADASAYAVFPDLPRSALRWQKTALAKIAADPQVTAFLEKPMSRINLQGKSDAEKILIDLKPGRIFAAITKPSGMGGGEGLLLGFQFYGGGKSLDGALSRLREFLGAKGNPNAGSYGKHRLESSLLENGTTLYVGVWRNWCFLSLSRTEVEGALDRADGKAEGPSLAEEPLFTQVLGELPKEPDFLAFGRMGPLMESLLKTGARYGATPIEEQVSELKKISGFGGAVKFEGAAMTDAIYVARTQKLDVARLNEKTLSLTSPETLFYAVSVTDWIAALAPLLAQPRLQTFVQALVQHGLDPSTAPSAFEQEFAVIGAWPPGAVRPRAALAVPIKEREEANRWALGLAQMMGATVSESDGVQIFTLSGVANPFLNPAFALSDEFFLVGLSPDEVLAGVRLPEGHQTLADAKAFQSAKEVMNRANISFGYLDVTALFERGYAALRPVAIFGAAMTPGLSTWIDASKLPETQAISQYLFPITYSQTQTDSGLLIESSGPFTMHQLAVVAAAGYAASQVYLRK